MEEAPKAWILPAIKEVGLCLPLLQADDCAPGTTASGLSSDQANPIPTGIFYSLSFCQKALLDPHPRGSQLSKTSLHPPPLDGSSSSLPLSSSSLLLFFSKGYSHDVAVYSVSLVGTICKPRPRTTAPPTSRTVPGPSDPKVPHQQQD